MAQPKKARGGFPYLWAVAGFCLVGVLAFVIRWSPGTEAYDRKVREDRLARLDEIQKAAEEKLSGYRWVDQEKQIVALPIERAMELAVADLRRESVGPSEMEAVSTGSLIVPPYLKPAAPAQEEAAEDAAAPAQEEAETAPAEGTEEAAPSTETAPGAEPAPASPAESPGEATPAPAGEQGEPTEDTIPAPEPAAGEAASSAAAPAAPAPATDGAATEPTATQAPSPSETTGEAAPDATAETPIGD